VSDQYFQQVVDGAGNVSFVPVTSAPSAAPASSVSSLVAGVVAAGSAYVSARAGEQSTLVGAVGGAALSPAIAQNAATAIAAGLAGDYVGAAAAGIPALIGIVGSLAAIFTPEKAKGLSDAQIQSMVGGLSTEQLIGLLEQQSANSSIGVAGNNAGAAISNSAVSAAVKTV
jgi:hypothetical protein